VTVTFGPVLTLPVPAPLLRERLDRSAMAQQQIKQFKVTHLDFHPRESHLVTFKDPYSFPTLFHPDCNGLVRAHMEDIAEKVREFAQQSSRY
jgi:syntaxin-binding protein 1